MNLSELFEMQKVLDERIIKEKGLEGKDLLPNTILALQVELGELANEWRGFKHWSNDQEPRREKMLVEYVDCLHFILSIGLQKGFSKLDKAFPFIIKSETVTDQFLRLFDKVGDFSAFPGLMNYGIILELFVGLGKMMDFTPEQIIEAYKDKNKVNHDRQASGY